jgi:hypothetical protein
MGALRPLLLSCVLLASLLNLAGQQPPPRKARSASVSAEEKAVAYLVGEVPLWKEENHCFSCHNNGDAARALYAAHWLSYAVPRTALQDTTDWLRRPQEWDRNRGDPRFSDKKLARIQFAAALRGADQAGLVREPQALVQAAASLLPDQDENGSWQVDAGQSLGSPVTYGPYLATHLALRVLKGAGLDRFPDAVSRAERWLVEAPLRSVMEAASVLLAFHEGTSQAQTKAAAQQVVLALNLIRNGQASDGGWGPYPRFPSEPFDTALAILALVSLEDRDLALLGSRPDSAR